MYAPYSQAVGTAVDCITSSAGTTFRLSGLVVEDAATAGEETGLLCFGTRMLPSLGADWRVMNSVCTGSLAAARRRAVDRDDRQHTPVPLSK